MNASRSLGMGARASGGNISGQMKAVFQVAARARCLGQPLPALLEALSKRGQPFRIGGAGALEAGFGEFETLTSGSSGQPRHIRRTMDSWIASFAVNGQMFGIGPGRRVAVLGALEQSLALYGAVEALHLGADVYALMGLRPDRQRAAMGQVGVEVLYASPAQLRLLIEAGGTDLPGLALVMVGGSKLDDGLRAALGQMAPGAEICEFYGAAETSFVTLARPGDPAGSVGGAYPGVQIECRGDPGEVWVRSPYLFAGYAGGDGTGAARWQDGWLSVGEIGRMEGGHLYLSGRAGRMVTVADQNVFPEQIEAVLMAMAGVRQAAVLPRPDPLRGVHLVAVLLGDRAQEAAILAGLRGQLGPLKAPKYLIWLQDWPILASVKTDLVALARQVGP